MSSPWKRICVLLFAWFSLFSNVAHAGKKLPLEWAANDVPQCGVPMMAKAPVIDGVIGGPEWQGAAELTGFSIPQDFVNVLPESLQPRVWIGYDRDKLYLAFRAPKIPGWKSSVNEKTKGKVILGGEHWWLKFHTPKGEYEFIFNPLGTLRDRNDANSYTMDKGLDWRSGAEMKCKVSEQCWDTELAVPFASLGHTEGPATDEVWSVHLITGGHYGDHSAEWNGAMNWNNGRCGKLIFSGRVPAFQFDRVAGLEEGKMTLEASVGNYSGKAQEVRVKVSLCCAAQELWSKAETLSLADGERLPLKFEKEGIVLPKNCSGRLELEADTPTDHLQSIIMQFSPLTPADYRLLSDKFYPFASPLSRVWGLSCANYPYYHKLEAWADITCPTLPAEVKQALSCEVELLPLAGGGALKSGTITFKEGKGRILWEDVDLPDGEYVIRGNLKGADGKVGDTVEHRFERRVYAWEHNSLGKSDIPYPPFTPIVKAGGNVPSWLAGPSGHSVWGRTYLVGQNGLPGGIVTTKETAVPGQRICGAFRLEATLSGKTEVLEGRTKVVQEGRGLVKFESQGGTASGLKVETRSELQYDGWFHVKLTVAPGRALERLELVIPFGAYPDTYYGYRYNWFYGALSRRQGTLWSNVAVENGKPGNLFVPEIAVGDGDTCLWWYAGSDQQWLLDYTKPSQSITRDKDGVNLRLAFVNHPATLSRPLELEFAVLANPAKPFAPDRREVVWELKPQKLFHDTGGYGYWGTGVDSITCGTDAEYKRFNDFLDRWTKRKEPGNEGFLCVEYNSGQAIGRCQPEFDSFSGEWRGETPWPVTPEFKDSDNAARAHLFHPTANYSQDWRGQPQKLQAGWCDLTWSNVDCRIWHYRRNIEKLGLNGYWFDNSPVLAGDNLLAGRAYLTADGKKRPNYSVFERHDLFRRLFTLYREAGVPSMNLVNYGADFTFADWFWMIEMDAYVYPPDVDLFQTLGAQRWYDVISRVTAVDNTPLDAVARHRAITRMQSIPGATCSNVRQGNIQGTRSVVGLAFLHDFGVARGVDDQELGRFRKILKRFDFGDPALRYLPYWRNSAYATFSAPDALLSLYQHPAAKAVLGIALNPAAGKVEGELCLSLKAAEMKNPVLVDPETMATLKSDVAKGTISASLAIPAHDYRLFLLRERAEEDIARKLTGTLDREYWLGIPGYTLKDAAGNAHFNGPPDGKDVLAAFEATNIPMRDFVERICGYIAPPETGDYIFWIAGTDENKLFLSQDEKPENKREIANTKGCGRKQWPWQPDAPNKSKPVALKAGKAYYVEVLHKKGQQGDCHLAVAWTKPFDDGKKPSELIPPETLSAFSAGIPPVAPK